MNKETKTMKISVIGGGAWGTTLAQVLSDNKHEVLVREINPVFIDKINKLHQHPFFDTTIPTNILATDSLEEVINYSEIIILALPTKFMRQVLKEIDSMLTSPKIFVNVSKGIEPETSCRVSEIVEQEIRKEMIKAYAVLSGPGHAEELIIRKLTTSVSASTNEEAAKLIQKLFSNDYLRVYTGDDVIGVETGAAIKNAIAVVSGLATGYGLGENARAALIARSIREIVAIVVALGGKKETAYGLSGIGDLIVTALSKNSRNFQTGFKIGQGLSVEEALSSSKQTVEGIRTIIAAYEIGQKHNLELPIIECAYQFINGKKKIDELIPYLMNRELKKE